MSSDLLFFSFLLFLSFFLTLRVVAGRPSVATEVNTPISSGLALFASTEYVLQHLEGGGCVVLVFVDV